ncbi:MAG: sulfite oxidase heme-binding subunit YedZ [Janthinobacterium lividum]
MTNGTIRILKPFVFAVGLLPLLVLLYRFNTSHLGADPVQFITHFTGNWTIYLLLISLAVTPVRRLSAKLAWLVRFRRMLGLFAFFYATLHLLTYVLLFSGFDLVGALASIRAHDVAAVRQQWLAVWPTMVDDVKKRSFIQVGLASYVILLALTLSSPQWVMRRMGGRPWQALHRLVYLAAILGVVHYWWLVKKGVMAPLRDTVILAVLLLARPAYRFIQKYKPVKSAKPTRAVV